MVRLVWEPVVVHDFSANKGLKWQSSEHVQPKEQARNVHQDIIIRKIVQNVPHGLGSESEIATKSHNKTCDQGDASRVVRHPRETVNSRFAQGAIDEKRVVVADESEGNDADGLEESRVYNNTAS